jgi:hypothetical protein
MGSENVGKSWLERLKDAIGPRGYENSMRRSLQTVILYEAKRCVTPKLSSLRPFQRKAAFLDQARALIESLDFLYPHQKEEILWRTGSSKENMVGEIAWKRTKGIEKSLSELADRVKPLMSKCKTHNEAVDKIVQSIFESQTNSTDRPFPQGYEHAHNHCIMAFRMYYRFDALDDSFPPPLSPRELEIPVEKQRSDNKPESTLRRSKPRTLQLTDASEPHVDVAELLGENQAEDNRRKLLQEVREHLELLQKFEGVIPEDELAQRKRELFLALPPAPPVCLSSKKPKITE